MMGYPAHCPYEDGWKFCRICQRFFKTDESLCPSCNKILLSASLRTKKGKLHEVQNEGKGNPKWFSLRETLTEYRQKFLEYRNSPEVFNKIKNAPIGINTFRKLGLKKYLSHWFVKNQKSNQQRGDNKE